MAREYVNTKVIKAVGVLFTISLFAFAIFMPMLACACKQATRYSWTIANCKQTSLAMIMYAADWDEYLPGGHAWSEKVAAYAKDKSIFYVKLKPEVPPRRFAMNKGVSGQYVPKLDSNSTAMVFDSISNGDSPVGGKVLLANYPGRDKFVIGFVDGHVKGHESKELKDIIWNPVIKK